MLRTILDSIPVMIVVLEKDGSPRWANRRWHEILGWTVEEAREQDFLRIMYPDPAERRRVADFIRAATGEWGDFRTASRDGRIVDTTWANIALPAGGNVAIGIDRSARAEAERERDAAVRRYEAIFAHSLDMITVAGDDRRYIDVNAAACRLLGYEREELIGLRVEDVIASDLRDEVPEAWSRFLAEGEFRGEMPLVTKEGRRLEAEHRSVANVLPGVHISFSRDISERREAELQLRLSEARFRSVFENAGLGIVLYDLDRGIQEPNPAFVTLVGRRRDQLVGLRWQQLTHPDDVARERPFVEAIVAGRRETYAIEKRYVRPGGEVVWAHLTVSVLHRKGETPTLAMAIVEDVTERRALEEAVQTSEEHFRRAFEEAPIGAALLDTELRIRRANRAFVEMSGYSPDELAGMSVRDLTLAEDQDPEIPGRLLREGSVRGLERRYRRKQGEDFWGRVSAAVLHDRAGRPEILAMVEDITELMRARARLEASLAEVRSLHERLTVAEERERHELTRRLHDAVGEDLTALSLNLGIVRQSLPPEAARAHRVVADSLEIVERFGARVRDLMTELRPPMLDDYGLAATLHWLGDRFAARRGLTTRVRGAEPVPRLSRVEEATLVRVASEALSNVLGHAEATSAWITLHSTSDLVRLTVTDDGVGFDPATATADGEGGGWGILGMRERMEALGGSLRLVSAPGEGTRVIAQLPRRAE